MKVLLLILLLPIFSLADNRWKKGDFVDQENARWELSGKKPRSPDRTLVKSDADGTNWYKDKEGDLFYLDPVLLVPIYKGRHGFFRKAQKETPLGYDFLCRERERNRYDGTPFLSEYSAAELKFPIRSYYEDVDRLLGLHRKKGCPSLKEAKKFESFLGELNSVCSKGCESMVKGHQRQGDFEMESYPKQREQEQIAECRKLCGRSHVKELNALQNYQAQNLLLFLEPAGAGKRGGFEQEQYQKR
jgi:hypothetical protein